MPCTVARDVYSRDTYLFFLRARFAMARLGWSYAARKSGTVSASRDRRDSGALSTSPSQASLAPSWKQEVNRRLEAHKSRKGATAAEPEAHSATHGEADSRAMQAAARVAARYAKAPSYSEMLAEEARGAVRAAEAASRAALEAQAAAESVLAGLEAASTGENTWAPKAFQSGASDRVLELAWDAATKPAQPAALPSSQAQERQSFGIRWDADLPVRPAEPAPTRA